MSAPTCAECTHGRITLTSATDRCKHPDNVDGLGPVAVRNDENLCGQAALLFVKRASMVDADPFVKPLAAQQDEVAPNG